MHWLLDIYMLCVMTSMLSRRWRCCHDTQT